jgi:hypothetical protein
VAGVGDVDGDGSADVAVGSRFYDAGESNEGAAFVFLPEPDPRLAWLASLALLARLDRRQRSHRAPTEAGARRFSIRDGDRDATAK